MEALYILVISILGEGLPFLAEIGLPEGRIAKVLS